MQNKQTNKKKLEWQLGAIESPQLFIPHRQHIQHILREVIIIFYFLILYLIKFQEVSLNDVIMKQ